MVHSAQNDAICLLDFWSKVLKIVDGQENTTEGDLGCVRVCVCVCV